MTPKKEDQIRRRAYELWQAEGQPHGHDVEHWQKAESELSKKRKPAGNDTEMTSAPNRKATPKTDPVPRKAGKS